MGKKSIPPKLGLPIRDYSQLPPELLAKIAEYVNSQIENLQFRSVCQSWRSSMYPVPFLTLNIPYPFAHGENQGGKFGTVYESTIYIVRPHDESRPESCSNKCWIMKVQQTSSKGRQLINPLSRTRVRSLPKKYQVNISGIKASAVGKEYHFLEGEFNPGVVKDIYPSLSSFKAYVDKCLLLYLLKRVIISPIASANNFVVIAIHFCGKLLFIKSGDEKWTVFEGQKVTFHDLMHYKGEFYAVDNSGRTYIVDPRSSELTQVVNPIVNGGQKKRLVHSQGDLFLVDVHMNAGVRVGNCDDYGHWWRWVEIINAFDARVIAESGDKRRIDRYICGAEDFLPSKFDDFYVPSSCKVFKLNEENKSWIQVESLGNQIFFVGDRSSFSISASDLVPGTKGNCVLYVDYCFLTDFFFRAYADALKHDIRVFNLEDGSFTKLESFPSYLELFLPTPTWFC